MKSHGVRDPEPYPVEVLKRVDRPTTIIHDEKVQRMKEMESGFSKALRGDYGPGLQHEMMTGFVNKDPLSRGLAMLLRNLHGAVDGPVNPDKAQLDDPLFMARHIKDVAYFLRADIVGICELPPYAVYSHVFDMMNRSEAAIEVPHKYAIAIMIDQDWKTAEAFTGSDWISNSMSGMAYNHSGFVACGLANYIRNLGYQARASHAMNYQVAVPPILLWAGLGEMCRIGECVLNPFLGPRFKAAVVTTDLPLVPDKPIDFGLQDFCSKCKKCARECPSGAISDGGKVMHNGYERWPVDVEKCTKMRVGNQKGSGCGTCIKVCPWNKPFTPFHRAVGWAMRHSSFARSLAIRGDDLMGYGKPHPEKQWWLDVNEIEGKRVPVIPKGRAGNP